MSSAAARRAGYQPATMPLIPAAARLPSIVGHSSASGPAITPDTSHNVAAASAQADAPAGDSDEARFRQRFRNDAAAMGADRPPDADLTRALRHRHERCVADDDDGGDERHDRDGRTGGAEPLRDRSDERPRRFGREDVELVGGARAEVAAGAHRARAWSSAACVCASRLPSRTPAARRAHRRLPYAPIGIQT